MINQPLFSILCAKILLFCFFLLSLITVSRSRGTVTCGSFLRFFRTIARGSFFCSLRAIARSRCFLFYLGANCTLFSTASATGGWSSLFLAASPAGSHSGAAHAGYQAGNTEPGQHFFQVFLFHCSLLFLRLTIELDQLFSPQQYYYKLPENHRRT